MSNKKIQGFYGDERLIDSEGDDDLNSSKNRFIGMALTEIQIQVTIEDQSDLAELINFLQCVQPCLSKRHGI